MCQQCTTEATAFKKRPFKGWFLVQATKDDVDSDGYGPEAGCWGIGVINNPAVWFDGTPAPDPTYGMTDEQEEAYYKNMTPEQKEADSKFNDFFLGIEEALESMYAITGHSLVEACIASGWQKEKGGLAPFIAHRVWLASQSEQWPHNRPAKLNEKGEAIPEEHED
jgi:hypothetical protein